MSNKHLPTIEYLRQRLIYEAETGILTWRYCEVMPNKWLARWANKEALATVNGDGYRVGKIDDKMYRAHRVAFAVHHGHWPTEHIDHINGDKTDNRICNLREATGSENQRNRSKPKNNTSGFKGVSLNKGKWMAQIMLNGKRYCLGTFNTPKDASIAYASAAKTMHGKFARVDG